jgi:hypothetical protein
MAGFAVLDAGKSYALQFEFSSNQSIQIRASEQRIAPGSRGLSSGQVEFAAKSVKDFDGKKRNLPFVVFLEIEETIAPDTAPGDTVEMTYLNDGILAGGLAVVAKEVVAGGDE